ncbi:autotransporter secretion inner membrane protein TamB [Litoreibacter halocynthiae]|uniref:Autotransporter secretion inner membrane protein TamB n=1 Tax=Litoreibacter halocynthiae TaxID=1242689 RepID=A0A4R7LMV6_9RHOB|nr:translocation/assembly module TamB domain-containing protein [Litoreibacter halocynthiae]TDT77363.1 autotransporter secretion inner membrane protein TamB [Litoreibacter halocynthiae]
MRGLLLCLLLVFAPIAAFAQQENSDRGYIQGLLEDALSSDGGKVTLEGFEGALSARATVERITVADTEGVWLSADGVSLAWNRSALLRGQIEIAEISVDTIDLIRQPVAPDTTLPTPEARGAFSLPDLPVSVNVDSLKIGAVNVAAGVFGEAAQVSVSGNARLANGAGVAVLEIERLDQAGNFSLAAEFDNTSRDLLLDLNLSEPADGIAVKLLNIPGHPSITLTVQGDDPVTDFSANILLATDGEDRLQGVVELKTDADGGTGFAVDLSGDVAPVFVPEFAEFLGTNIQLIARGDRSVDGGINLDELNLQTAAMQIKGSAEIGADGWPNKLKLDGEIVPPEGVTVVLPLPGPATSVKRVELFGTFDAEAGEAWQLLGRASGVEQTGLRLDLAKFDAAGTIEKVAGSVDGTLQLEVEGIALQDAALAQAVGDRLRGGLLFEWANSGVLSVREIDLSGSDYGLTGALSVDATDSVEAIKVIPDLQVIAEDLSRFAGLAQFDLSGAANLAVAGALEPLTGVLDLNFDGTTRNLATGIAQLDPLLSGEGKLTLGLSRDENGLKAEPLKIATDHASIDASATLQTDGSVAMLRAKLPDVAKALPELSGAADLTVEATQDADVWTIATTASLPGGTQADYRGTVRGFKDDNLLVDGTVTAVVESLSAFSKLAGQGLSGGINLEASGNADILRGSFDLSTSGQTQSIAFGQPTLEPLLRGATRFDLSATRDVAGVTLIRSLEVDGSAIDAQVSGSFGPESGQLDYRVSLANLGLIVPDFPGPANVSGTAVKQQQSWAIDASGQGPGGVAVAANGRVAEDFSTVAVALNGSAPLALINARLPGQNLTGLARFDLQVNGPPALQSVSGQVSLVDGRLAIPARSTALNQINGQVRLSGGQAQLSFEAGVSTGGRVTLSGPVSLTSPYNAQLAADLQRVTLRDASLFETTLGGRLTVNGALLGGAAIGGVIDVETAEIRIPQFGPSYSALEGLRHLNPSQDVRRTLRFAGLDKENDTAERGSPGFPLNLTLRIPSRLFVRGRGLDAELGGTLGLTGTTNNVNPVGGFDLIRGRLDLLGRRLNLTEGSVRLRGDFDPVIKFAATSQVEDVTVGLLLEGLASEPEVTVTSSPELPEEEALSLLLFGREVTQISAFQAVQLALAVQTLAGRSGTSLTDGLRDKLGVDDLDIGTDADGNTQAKAGKYISDNIYTDVTVKSDGESQINLNLEVSPTVTVRGRLSSDGDTGIGVFFEKDY